MKKAFFLLFFLSFIFSLKSQPIELCQTQGQGFLDKNRNQDLHAASTLNTGYWHDFNVPPPPTSSCPVELSSLFIEVKDIVTMDNVAAQNAALGTDCAFAAWFVDVFYDCTGNACPVQEKVDGACQSYGPIAGLGTESEELMACPINAPGPTSTISIDIMPAMSYGGFTNCPNICTALPDGYVDIVYSEVCVTFEYTAVTPPTPFADNNGPYCFGDDIELEADGGTDYQWSGPNGFSSTDQFPIIPNATGLNAGTYDVTVSTGPGCEDYASTIVDITEITVSIDDIGGPSCFQGINGFADLSASGGSGPYDYDWFPGGYTTSFVDELAAGITYDVFVTDFDGCEGYIEIEVFDPPEVVVTLDNSQGPSCATATDGQATFSVTGGDSPYDIMWSPGGFNTFAVNTLGVGTYDVTVTDFNDCEGYGTVTLTPAQSATITFTPVMPFCPENTTETLMATPMGGTWSGAVNTSGSFNPSTLSAGSHDAIYTYTYGGNCEAKDTLEITILPSTTIAFGTSVFCRNLTTAMLTATPIGGTWSGAGITTTGEINPSMLTAGMHTFSYAYTEPNNNCTTTQDFTITIEEPPTIVINGDNDFCQTAGMQTYTATPMNGTWGGVANMSGRVDASALAVGMHDITYTVTVGNCTATSTYPITVTAPPSGTLSGGGNLCSGGTSNLDLNLTGTGPWMVTLALGGVAQVPFSVTTSPHQQSVNQAGTYTIVSVSDASGCVGMGTGSAAVNAIAPLIVTNVQTQCDATNTNFVLTFDISGGDPTSYQVTGLIGTVTGTTFTSQSIPQGTTVNFTVSDNTNCGTVSDNVSVNCACTTSVGTMDLTQLEICGTGTAVATYNNTNENLDGNDALQFVLHDAAGVSLGNILGINTTPSFAFSGTMMYGTTYYISAIAGNNDGSGNVDQSDNCLQVAQGTPVVFYEIPAAALSGGNPICEGESAILTFTLTGNPPWSVQYSDGTNSFDLNGIATSPFTVTVMPTATTTYSATSTSNGSCIGTASGTVTVTVNTPPSADVTMIGTVCNSTQSGEPTTFDFSTLVTNGDRNGTWMDVDGSGATGTLPSLDFNGITPGDYIFRYTTNSAVAPCSEATYDVTITVRDCNCPSVQTSGAGPFCDDDAMVDLSTITVTTENGNWSIINQPAGSSASINGGLFNATGSAAGSYELEYRLTTTAAGCPESSTQTIVVNAPPTAQVTNTTSVCNSSQSGEPTMFDFSTLVIGGDMLGTWTDVDGSGATGTFPNLDFENIGLGDYTFRYTTNSAMAPCMEASYEVTISVRDCNCPSVETTSAGPFCNDDVRVELNNLTITTESGDWTIINQPAGSTASIANNIFSANGSPEGSYELEFRLNNPVAGCAETSTQTIQLFAPPSADVTNAGSVCNSSQSGDPTTFDFSTLINAGDRNGTWVDVDGSGATGTFPTLDFENITLGNYTFSYTTNSATAPCSEATYNVTITVQDCSCPSVLTTGAGPFCNDNATIDLTQLTLTTEDGNWTIVSEPTGSTASITNNDFNANGSPSGDYELEFRLTTAVAGCPEFSTQTIMIDAAPNAGDILDNLEICEGVDTIVSLFDLIENFDAGNWSDISLNPIATGFDASSGTLSTTGVSVGNYSFSHMVTGNGVCSDAATQVEVIINESPTADAGMDVEIDCENTEVNIGGMSTGGLGISYSWSGDVENPNARTTMTSQPGIYVITVRNTATGCSDSDEVEVTVSNDFPLLDPSHTDVSCPDLADGTIEVGNISGGQAPYMFSLNGSPFTGQISYPDLPAGTYILKVEDAIGCVDSVSIEVLESAPINAVLSASRTLIQAGESTTLTASSTATIDSILWSPANEFNNCFDCLTQMVSPEIQTTYSIRVVDENGCDAIASVTINLEAIIEDGVFIPSAFSPNNDGINDFFLPFAGSRIAKINYFYVYDRWGEPVHKVTDMEPNDQSAGWDGTFRGKMLNTAVFAWAAEVEYTDGTSRVFEGDVSLFR